MIDGKAKLSPGVWGEGMVPSQWPGHVHAAAEVCAALNVLEIVVGGDSGEIGVGD